MFRNSRAAVSLVTFLFGLGLSSAASAQPNNGGSLCDDPAVAAAIDRQESANIAGDRLPGSGIELSAFEALADAGVRITSHRVEIIGGQVAAAPGLNICRVRLHVKASTLYGSKEAAEEFAYRIESTSDGVAATFCRNDRCEGDASAIAPPGRVQRRTAQNERSSR